LLAYPGRDSFNAVAKVFNRHFDALGLVGLALAEADSFWRCDCSIPQVVRSGRIAWTMMLKLQVFVFPEVSTAVFVTAVVPSGKTDPEAGEQ